MNRKLQGIIPALLTPFGGDGGVNTDALKRVIDWNIEKGVDGFTSAEAPQRRSFSPRRSGTWSTARRQRRQGAESR